jgi:hypothetical protein
VVAAAVIWQATLDPRVRETRYREEMMGALRSADPSTRKQAAWRIVERPDPLLAAYLVEGVLGAESDPDVREAFVYSLGKLADPHNFAAIEIAIDSDPSGYVRAAAWLAAARCDPEHFRTLVTTRSPPTAVWDRIGQGQGWLLIGNVRGVEDLLRQAVEGDAPQRQVCARALSHWLRPLLDAAGRWPIDAQVSPGQSWPPDLVSEVKRRCTVLDLQAIADDTRRLSESARRVGRNVRRLTRARDLLAGLLFGD